MIQGCLFCIIYYNIMSLVLLLMLLNQSTPCLMIHVQSLQCVYRGTSTISMLQQKDCISFHFERVLNYSRTNLTCNSSCLCLLHEYGEVIVDRYTHCMTCACTQSCLRRRAAPAYNTYSYINSINYHNLVCLIFGPLVQNRFILGRLKQGLWLWLEPCEVCY